MPGMRQSELYKKVLEYFAANNPLPETELHYINPYQLVVATILSAQCTDKRVNLITPPFFQRFPDAETLAAASVDEVFSYIRTCSYPNNKAKNLLGMAQTLVNEFNSVVPSDTEALQRMPGVGRKTANVIASVVFKQPAMAVDTHVFRVAARIGLTREAKNPRQSEDQLMKHIPLELVHHAHHWLILHGRYVCKARKPLCSQCGISHLCGSRDKFQS
jgi:endonuclease III